MVSAVVMIFFAFIAFCIVLEWTMEISSPLPKEITGKIEWVGEGGISRHPQIRVKLIDSHNKVASRGEGCVDTENGTFVLYPDVAFGDQIRTLRVSEPECADAEYELTWRDLRAGNGLKTVRFKCIKQK